MVWRIVNDREKNTYQFPCGVAPTSLNKIDIDSLGVQLVLNTPYKWGKNKLLVYFVDVEDEDLMDKTVKTANTWSRYSNIKFELTSSIYESDLRVSFLAKKGYASALGIEAEEYKFLGKPTIYLQNLHKRTDTEFKRVVLHEFGHAIGLEHELQNPEAIIKWDSSKVYKYYEKIYEWDSVKVNKNIFKKIITDDYSKFDSKSIMIYAVPDSLTKNGVSIPWPRELSKLDKKTINIFYPF